MDDLVEKRYLFFAERAYSYEILRPLQEEIRRRGGEVAWLLGDECPDRLGPGEIRMPSVQEAIAYGPRAVFAPGDWLYDMLPGVKVKVFHGFPISKRGGARDAHFRMRGWFDIYMTSGPSGTPRFEDLASKLGYFAVYETGWCKTDAIVKASGLVEPRDPVSPPRIFVASTFSHRISALRRFYPVIERLARERDWEWVVTRHPMLDDPELDALYSRLAAELPNVSYYPSTPGPELMASTDVMLCDASSIMMEYAMLDKPIVTLGNTQPGPHLIDVADPAEIEGALLRALTRPPELMAAVRRWVDFHEAHRDGHNCARILDAVDDFIDRGRGKLRRRKPLNLFRRLKLRLRLLRRGEFPF